MESSGLLPLVPLVVLLPVAGLLINIIFGGRMNEKVIGVVASGASGLAFVVSALLGFSLWSGSGEAVVMLNAVAAMVTPKVLLAVPLALSVTCTVMAFDPGVVGAPQSVPSLAKVSPGTEPEEIVHE